MTRAKVPSPQKLPPPPTRPDTAEDPAPPEPTVGDMIALPADEPALPGFEVSDEPFPASEQAGGGFDVENVPDPVEIFDNPDVEIMPPHLLNVSYESRIQVLEAWRYVGNFQNAPDWVDRNWLAHGDYDPLRQIEPGPALRVPLESGTVYARIGDYLCKQAITLAAGVPAEIRLEVWPAETFQKLFMPRHPSIREDARRRPPGISAERERHRAAHVPPTSTLPPTPGVSSTPSGLDVA